MKKREKRELGNVALAGFILGICVTLSVIEAMIPKRKKSDK